MFKTKLPFVLKTVGLIEILIGGFTLAALVMSVILSFSAKPIAVFLFVLISSLLSLSLGFGLLRQNALARTLLLFFAGYVIITKALLAADLISISGALEATIPEPIKNATSILYHSFLIWYLNRREVRAYFRR